MLGTPGFKSTPSARGTPGKPQTSWLSLLIHKMWAIKAPVWLGSGHRSGPDQEQAFWLSAVQPGTG